MRSVLWKTAIPIALTIGLSAGSSFGQFTALSSIGSGAASSITTNGGGSYTFTGGGNDTWDAEDDQGFAWTEVSGDFDVKVRIESLQAMATWSKAGIEVREGLSPRSRMAWERVTPRPASDCTGGGNGANDVHLSYRTWIPNSAGASGGQHEDGGGNPAYPNAWVRLQRVGSVINGYYGTDGSTWTSSGSQDTTGWGTQPGWPASPLPGTLYVGLAVSRHSGNCPTAVCEFRDFAMTLGSFGGPFAVNSGSSRGNPLGVRVYFTRAVNPASASNPLNYSISGSGIFACVLNATVRPEGNAVDLTLDPGCDALVEGNAYRVTATAVLDAGMNPLTSDPSSANFVHGAGYEQHRVLIANYRLGGESGAGGNPAGLLTSPAYLYDTPDFRFDSAAWEDAVTVDSGDPQNEQFCTRIQGVLNITTEGNYRFAVSSDDNSSLYLSSDDSPAHKVRIANEPQWNGHRQYAACDRRTCVGGVPVENHSAPQHLVPGKYYLEHVSS